MRNVMDHSSRLRRWRRGKNRHDLFLETEGFLIHLELEVAVLEGGNEMGRRLRALFQELPQSLRQEEEASSRWLRRLELVAVNPTVQFLVVADGPFIVGHHVMDASFELVLPVRQGLLAQARVLRVPEEGSELVALDEEVPAVVGVDDELLPVDLECLTYS